MKMNKWAGLTVAVAMTAVLFAGCGGGDAATPSASAAASAKPSASSAPASAEATPEAAPEALEGEITMVGSTSVGPVVTALQEMFHAKYPDVDISVEQNGSGPGIQAAMDGSADIGMASRELKDDEQPLTATQLCLDGISVVVNPENPVKGLTKEQLAQIYKGEITNWKDVGGNDGEIVLVTRESTSGTRGAFEELVLGEGQIDDKLCLVVNSNGDVGKTIEGEPNAIGYMSMGIVENYEIAALTMDEVEPTADNVKSGDYALSRPFLLLTKEEPEGVVKAFIEYMTTDEEAIAYMEEKGYIIP
ncbi:phosphate ABC transporter substrate-binding protein [Gehongia tenuis]|uniref:Phosphate-binding protein n=1 Tax=Gehongia tenuis TaxID=2763655 RepID=A0A926D432_9FIRM|nr:phosphate ABC transporter substrate-binding protein [Gehongia tenuis]MBC8530876.1 phosphate ABC transporter substrate-binding protein [Gehongia tenuis]